VGRKDDSTSTKKDSWREWKEFSEMKKKHDASSNNDNSERGIVCASGIAAILGSRSWESVVSNDNDDDELFPILVSAFLT